ncbi:MAG TPA: hypothetical protein VML55_17890 [Planctomycetaceae bacterium]|nr:hypothetical protein [Planctomycetaceae bacterium]
MRSPARPWIACVSLAGYVLALGGAVVFHDHAGHDHAHHGTPDSAASTAGNSTRSVESHPQHADCPHGHGHAALAGEPRDQSPPYADGRHGHERPHAPPHDDDCAACHFLALKLLPAAAPVVVSASQAVVEAASLVEPAVPHPLPWRPLSRGPPASV